MAVLKKTGYKDIDNLLLESNDVTKHLELLNKAIDQSLQYRPEKPRNLSGRAKRYRLRSILKTKKI